MQDFYKGEFDNLRSEIKVLKQDLNEGLIKSALAQ